MKTYRIRFTDTFGSLTVDADNIETAIEKGLVEAVEWGYIKTAKDINLICTQEVYSKIYPHL